MQYFNEYNSEVEYIKDLLRSVYIPTVRVFHKDIGTQPTPTTSTITPLDNETTISQNASKTIFKNETIIYDNTVRVGNAESDSVIAKDTRLIDSEYKFGKWYLNYSSNYKSNKNYYDPSLHEWLGRYLRAYRDYYTVDVMNFYNCYSDRYFSDIALPIPAPASATKLNGLSFNPSNDKYKITAFPILWDTSYRVKFYTEAMPTINMQAVYYDGSTIVGAAEYTSEEVEDEEIYTPITYTISGETEFSITIGSVDASNELSEEEQEADLKYKMDRQKLLYLFIQYPSTISCPIVVIEQTKFTKAINNELLDLSFTNKRQVAFCDTLLEYLLGAVICPAFSIGESITHVQKILSSQGFYKEYGVGGPNYVGLSLLRNPDSSPKTYKFRPGVFDDKMQQIIYKAFFDNGRANVVSGIEKPVQNFIGFVDTDIESRLNKIATRYGLSRI